MSYVLDCFQGGAALDDHHVMSGNGPQRRSSNITGGAGSSSSAGVTGASDTAAAGAPKVVKNLPQAVLTQVCLGWCRLVLQLCEGLSLLLRAAESSREQQQ